MHRFLKKLSLILILPILSIVVFDIWLRNINTSYTEKYDGLMAQKDSVQVLFLGNSHANYSIDPTAFPNYYAYNLANLNQRIYFDKRLTLKAIDEGVQNLKYVFISLDYHSLYSSNQGQREIWSYYGNGIKNEDTNYFLANLSPLFWGYTPKVSFALLKKKIKNKVKYRGLKTIDFDVEDGVNVTDTVKQGYIGRMGQNKYALTPQQFKNRVNYFNEPEESIRNEVILDLTDFIKKLKEKNIEPILFSSPTYTAYNEYLDTNILQQNAADIAEICTTYNVSYWDYMNSNKFDLDDFYDSDHLNKKGAIKFTQMLSNRLDTYESSTSLK